MDVKMMMMMIDDDDELMMMRVSYTGSIGSRFTQICAINDPTLL